MAKIGERGWDIFQFSNVSLNCVIVTLLNWLFGTHSNRFLQSSLLSLCFSNDANQIQTRKGDLQTLRQKFAGFSTFLERGEVDRA